MVPHRTDARFIPRLPAANATDIWASCHGGILTAGAGMEPPVYRRGSHAMGVPHGPEGRRSP